MDPHGSVPVPDKQDVPEQFIGFITMDKAAKVLGPTFFSLPVAQSLPLGESGQFMFIGFMFCLAVMFSFLPVYGVTLDRYIANHFKFKRSTRQYTSDPKRKDVAKSSEFLQFEGIQKNGILVYRDNKTTNMAHYVRIVRVTPPNYQMLREDDKSRALSIFGSILNGADKPFQVITNNYPYDPEDYFRVFKDKVPKHGKAFKKHTLEYLNFFEAFGKQQHVMDRDYFFVFKEKAPFQPKGKNLTPGEQESRMRAMRGLQARAENVRSQFSAMEAKVEVVEQRDALRILQRFLNPASFSKGSKLKHVMNADKAKEKVGVLQVPDIEIARDYIKLGNDYTRTITIKQYPDRLGMAWLNDVLNLDQRVTASLHYEPKLPSDVLRKLKKARASLRVDIQNDEKKGLSDPEKHRLLASIEEQMLAVHGGSTKFFEVSVYLTCHGTTRRQLDEVTEEVQYKLRNLSLTPFQEHYKQQAHFISALPLGENVDTKWRQTMHAACATTTYPFITSSIKHPEGNWLGNHTGNGAHYIVDRWAYKNYNRIVAGTSGAGKSYCVKLDMERTLMREPDAQIFVIDPLSEFGGITELLDGQIIKVGAPGVVINPFELEKHEEDNDKLSHEVGNPFDKKLSFLDAFFRIVLEGRIGAEDEAHLKLTLKRLYESKGITQDESTHHNEPPTLSDLMAMLKVQLADPDDYDLATSSKRLHTLLEAQLTGPLSYLDGQTNVNMERSVVTFDLKNLDKSYFQVFMFIVLNFIEGNMYKDVTRRKCLYIDEAWYLLEEEYTARELSQMNRHTRHVNMGVDYITQTPDSFFANDYGRAIRMTCQQTILFRQETVSHQTRDGYGLDDNEAEALTTMGKGENMNYSVMMYIGGGNKVMLMCFSSPGEHNLVTTNPEDLKHLHAAKRAQAVNVAKEAATKQRRKAIPAQPPVELEEPVAEPATVPASVSPLAMQPALAGERLEAPIMDDDVPVESAPENLEEEPSALVESEPEPEQDGTLVAGGGQGLDVLASVIQNTPKASDSEPRNHDDQADEQTNNPFANVVSQR